MDEEREPSHWEFVMFDSTTGTMHDVVCAKCRKPRRQLYGNYCANCGAYMRKEHEEW